MIRYSLKHIADLTGGRLVGEDVEVDSVLTDSRSYASSGSTLFAAQSGVNHDAHDFVEQMCSRGVKAFLVERECSLPSSCGQVVVGNTLRALQRLAADNRNAYRGTVIAVTGSNGKTVVKEWIAQTAPASEHLYRSPRSYNSQLGVALSLLMIDPESKAAVIEAGISCPGEMDRLEKMIRPDIAVFTSIGDAHQENFDTLEDKIEEKIILARNAATIIYNSTYAPLARVIEARYDNRQKIDAAMFQVPEFPDEASKCNAQTVSALFSAMDYPTPDFSLLRPVKMRLDVKQGISGSVIIDDTYSADLNSLAIAIDYLKAVAGSRRRILILSEILQSGLPAAALYAQVAQMVRDSGIDLFVGIGKEISRYRSAFDPGRRFYSSTEELLAHLSEIDIENAAILIKGNRDSQTDRISRRLEMKSHTTVLEVNLKAMERNINYFRSRMKPGVRLTAMVKASSYGAGDAEIARALENQGISYLAVAFADEGVALREAGIRMPIVVLNADDASFDQMISYQLQPEIYSFRSLEAFALSASDMGTEAYPIHVKLDTGMHRLGFAEEDIPQLLKTLEKYSKQLRVESVFTHLCVADDEGEDAFTRCQIEKFDRCSSAIQDGVGYRVIRHCSASAAITRFPEAQFDMCRLGLGLYGFGYKHNDALEPVSELKTRIVQIRELLPGETVGYGRAGKIERKSRIATVPIGYADGLDRRLGCGVWSMTVAGHRAPIVGRICMDSCMIDITDIEGIGEGDPVTIFSREKGSTAEDMAELLGTIPYEILTSVAKRVKRVYVNE